MSAPLVGLWLEECAKIRLTYNVSARARILASRPVCELNSPKRVGMYMYMQISTHIYPLPRVSGENIVRDVHIACTVQDDVILFSFHSNCVRVFSFHTG